MISLGIGTLREQQNALGTKFNTKTASLTTIIDDMHDTVSNQDAVSIQWLSPKSHSSSSTRSICHNQ
jgi:hypothetical protein